jgi:hypothetical protein
LISGKLANAISDALSCELYNLKMTAPGAIDLCNVDGIEKYYCKGGLFGIFGRNRPVFEDINSCKDWAKKITE